MTYVGFAWIPPLRRHHAGRQRYRVRQAYRRRPSTRTPAPASLPPGPRPRLRKAMRWDDVLAIRGASARPDPG